jgi:hypothetical protein
MRGNLREAISGAYNLTIYKALRLSSEMINQVAAFFQVMGKSPI